MIDVPEILPFNTALVKVLFVKVCDPVSVATVESIAISSAFAVIPVPPITFNVTVPVVPPPVNPVPAITPSISPEPSPPPPPYSSNVKFVVSNTILFVVN